ncbi:SPFH domain-containing protein, partial [candidate division KSB1 bacterium]
MNLTIFPIIGILVLIFLLGIRIVRPTHRGLIERLGKYNRFSNPGSHWIIPVIERMFQVNTTEQMVDAEPQEIITNDNLNARVDAQVYFRVKSD